MEKRDLDRRKKWEKKNGMEWNWDGKKIGETRKIGDV